MKILLTGSEGFIGQHLFKFLNEQGHKVICIDKSLAMIYFPAT